MCFIRKSKAGLETFDLKSHTPDPACEPRQPHQCRRSPAARPEESMACQHGVGSFAATGLDFSAGSAFLLVQERYFALLWPSKLQGYHHNSGYPFLASLLLRHQQQQQE